MDFKKRLNKRIETAKVERMNGNQASVYLEKEIIKLVQFGHTFKQIDAIFSSQDLKLSKFLIKKVSENASILNDAEILEIYKKAYLVSNLWNPLQCISELKKQLLFYGELNGNQILYFIGPFIQACRLDSMPYKEIVALLNQVGYRVSEDEIRLAHHKCQKEGLVIGYLAAQSGKTSEWRLNKETVPESEVNKLASYVQAGRRMGLSFKSITKLLKKSAIDCSYRQVLRMAKNNPGSDSEESICLACEFFSNQIRTNKAEAK